jgi:hypothetical protein
MSKAQQWLNTWPEDPAWPDPLDGDPYDIRC